MWIALPGNKEKRITGKRKWIFRPHCPNACIEALDTGLQLKSLGVPSLKHLHSPLENFRRINVRKKKKIKWALKLTEVIVKFYITDNDRTRFWHLLTCHIVMHSLLTHVHFFVSFELAATMFPKVPALINGCLHLQIHYGTIRCYLQPSARGREGSFWLLRGRGKRPDEQVQCGKVTCIPAGVQCCSNRHHPQPP